MSVSLSVCDFCQETCSEANRFVGWGRERLPALLATAFAFYDDGMLDWLFKKPRFYRYPDTFGYKQQTIDDAVCEAISARLSCDDVVLVVCHFPKTFERVERLLQQKDIQYEIPTDAIDSKWILENAAVSGQLFLTLSPMLNAQDSSLNVELQKRQLSILVTEKNPQAGWDDQIEDFAKQSVFLSKVGYYLSFDQPLINYCFGQKERQLLRHWTSIDDIVFASTLASRRIDAKIRSHFGNLQDVQPADSIEQWLQTNSELHPDK